MVTVEVEYDYEAELQDELTIHAGDILTSVKQMSGGWWEGVLKGKRGLFPENFVKVLKSTDVTPPPPPSLKPDINDLGIKDKIEKMGNKELEKSNQSEEDEEIFKIDEDQVELRKYENPNGKRCRVLFSYQPAHDDELDLAIDQVIDFLGEVEDGWWKGRSMQTGKTGVFPSNFVEMCAENEPITSTTPIKKPISNNKQIDSNLRGSSENLHNLSKKNSIKNTAAEVADKNRKNEANNSSTHDSFTNTKGDKIFSSSSPTAQQLHSKVNLQQEKIEKKKNSHLITTTSLQQSTISNGADKSSKAGNDSKPNFLVPKPNFMSSKSPKMEKNNSENALKNAPRLPPKPVKEQCIVQFPYTALNEDELSLAEGQIVTIISKEVEDKGWWKGELDGKVGVFPDNFVKLLITNTAENTQKVRGKSFSPSQPTSLISSINSSLNSAQLTSNNTVSGESKKPNSHTEAGSTSINGLSNRKSSIKQKSDNRTSTSASSLSSVNSTPTKSALPPSGVSSTEARQSQPKGVAGGISIFGNANSDLMASMKAKSGSLTKISDNIPNGTNNATESGGAVAQKKKSFGKGTVAPKPKAPSLPHENNKTADNRNSRNSSGGIKSSNIRDKAKAFMDDIRSKSSEDLASAKQKSRDRSSSSSSLKGSRKNSEINTSSTVGVTIDDEKGVDFDSIPVGQNNNKSGKDGEEGKLIHLTANRAKAPKRRPPSSHFIPGNNSRESLTPTSLGYESSATLKLESSTSGPEKSMSDSQQRIEGGENIDISEVVLRKRSDTNPSSNITPNLSSPTSNSSIHMSLNINPTSGDQDKNAKVPNKKPEWLAELSRKQQHRKSEKFLDQSKRPVVAESTKPARHSMAPFGIHSLTRQGGIGSGRGDIPTSSSSDNLVDDGNVTQRPSNLFNKFEQTESTSVNSMVSTSTRPIIPPVSEKPQLPQDKPHIPSKPLSTNFNKTDNGVVNDAIASRTNISNISSRLIESKSDSLTKVAPGSEVSNSLPSTTSQVSTNTSSSKSLPQKPAIMEKETEALQSPRKTTPEKNESTAPKSIEPESKTISSPSGGIKASPFMIPKDPAISNNTTGAGSLVSPSEGNAELVSNKSHAGGWMRPKETSVHEGETHLQKRVTDLEMIVEKLSQEMENMKQQLSEERQARQRLEAKISSLK